LAADVDHWKAAAEQARTEQAEADASLADEIVVNLVADLEDERATGARYVAARIRAAANRTDREGK
jgi:hypothetical protein